METSAFSGDNIDKAFDIMVKEIYEKYSSDVNGEGELDSGAKGEDLKLEKATDKQKKKCC